MSEDIISTVELTKRAEIVYDFLDTYTTYRSIVKDYGTSETFSMTEIHLLDYIDKNPGSTVTDVAIGYRRSKSLVSQVVSTFEKGGYLIRMVDPQDAKKQRLYLSKDGKRLNEAHMHYDETSRIEAYRALRKQCSREEVNSFYSVMAIFTEHLKSVIPPNSVMDQCE